MYQINTIEHNFTIPKIGTLTIKGYSKSTYRTGYLIKPYNIYLDAGLPSPIPASLILVSHGHLDHIAALYSLLVHSKKSVVMLPRQILSNTQLMLDSFKPLNSGYNTSFRNWKPITLSEYNTTINNKKLYKQNATRGYIPHKFK